MSNYTLGTEDDNPSVFADIEQQKIGKSIKSDTQNSLDIALKTDSDYLSDTPLCEGGVLTDSSLPPPYIDESPTDDVLLPILVESSPADKYFESSLKEKLIKDTQGNCDYDSELANN